MLNLRIGKVEKILENRDNTVEVLVRDNGKLAKAIAYKDLVNNLRLGDIVTLNTTANDLSLGTGGYHFILNNLNSLTNKVSDPGHIMKLRYTPLQIKVSTCEEQGSKYHYIFNNFNSLNKMPVLVGGLHSMVVPLTVTLKHFKKDLNICYIMTDGGALPIGFSKSVYYLKQNGYIDSTVTIGHAFGGDYESVNIYNGLIAAKEVAKCDLAIVAMGPGIVGTGTNYGFSGIEQGNIIDAVNDLGGTAICVPRISFKDERTRHFGISHHTLTILNKIAKTKSLVGIPKLSDEKVNYIKNQINTYNISVKHDILFLEYDDIIDVIKSSKVPMNTMGRDVENDLEYFLAIAVNAKVALKYLNHDIS
ncbi:MAG: hypothetical protein PWQ37_1650 [Candidatus Petromonas sp.]|jgi:hypothetical protein|nr:hypothetical protein [Candidatus Petromonas sp.]